MIEGTSPLWFVPLLLFIINTTIRISALFWVPRNRTPASGTAWLIVVLLLPIPGALAFLLVGNNRMPKARRGRLRQVSTEMGKSGEAQQLAAGVEPSALGSSVQRAVNLGMALGAQPMLAGNAATISFDYEESIAMIAAGIREAQEFVHIEFYILSYDSTTADVFEAIKEVSARGVTVRVLMDHIASVRQPGLKTTIKKLEQAGAEWKYMLPVRPWKKEWQRPDLRNHRKLVVVDGVTGFMGSQNLIDASYNKRGNIKKGLKWRDIFVRFTGPVVRNINNVFIGDWYVETGVILEERGPQEILTRPRGELNCQVLASGPGFGDENNMLVFLALMQGANTRISITSPYFVPDPAILYALKSATARGVKVELFVSETGDQAGVYHAQRSYYDELLRAGVRIFMFKAPYILHSKHLTIDDEVAVIGSSNMDQRSFNLNAEVSMVISGKGFVDELDRANNYYHENSRELTLTEWKEQPLRSQLLDGLARLTSALQ